MMVTGATAGGGVDHRGAARDVPARQDWAVEAEGYSTVYGAAVCQATCCCGRPPTDRPIFAGSASCWLICDRQTAGSVVPVASSDSASTTGVAKDRLQDLQ